MIAWPVVAALLCLYFKLNIIYAITLFYVIPSIYLSCKIPGQVKKSLIVAFAGGTLWSTLDYIWELSKAWATPTFFPFKFLGVASMENVLWSYLWVYFVVIFYEYFFERDRNTERTTSLGYKLLEISCFGFIGLVTAVFILKIDLFLPYSYLLLGLLCTLPVVFLLTRYPRLRSKFFGVGVYFFYYSLVLELLALDRGYWYFPKEGQFIGHVTLFGLTFPIEEFILFVSIGSIIVLSWYELFDDDRK